MGLERGLRKTGHLNVQGTAGEEDTERKRERELQRAVNVGTTFPGLARVRG